jgi:hypothetical protein
MSINDIGAVRRALEKRLASLATNIATAIENGSYTPTEGVPYQRLALLRAEPESLTMGRRLTREHGIFQVSLMYPTGEGPGDAEAQAQLVKDHFKCPLTLVEGNVNVFIVDAVKVSTGFVIDSRFMVPVSIPWHANIAE